MAIFYNTDHLPVFNNPVITIGTFDGVHHGHCEILNEVVHQAQQIGGESIVLTFHPHPRKLLFPDQSLKTLTTLEQKLQLISEAGVDHIVVVPFTHAFAALSATEYIEDFLVKIFHPSRIVIGYDHHFGHDRTGNIELLKSLERRYGFTIQEIPAQLIEQAAVSSTKIRHALQEGRVDEAAKMLGRSYAVKGKVLRGAQLGRTIGFPTANLQPEDADQLIPANGVYAVLVHHHNKQYKAMLNIGYRPTVSNEQRLTTEAHIFDFSGDIYDQELEILFISRLRDEQKFASLDALKEQLNKDRTEALNILNQFS